MSQVPQTKKESLDSCGPNVRTNAESVLLVGQAQAPRSQQIRIAHVLAAPVSDVRSGALVAVIRYLTCFACYGVLGD